MRPSSLKELFDKQLLTSQQFEHLNAIATKRIFSVYYELRIILYLGVVLFTTGVGILIYNNIGDIGHIVIISLLVLLTATCFYYAFTKAPPYSHEKIKAPSPYFDYVVLLGALLFISVLTYLQLQFELFDDGMGATTLVTALFFFYAAYRFDHLGILSLGITAFASFWSITVTPQKWYSGDFLQGDNLHNTAIILGAAIAATALFLQEKSIKKHFTFTYVNFASLIYLAGALTGVFSYGTYHFLYYIVLFGGCAALVYHAQRERSFLFVLYAAVAAYIGFTYLLGELRILDDAGVIFFYMLLSCGALILFIIRFKSFFKRA